MKAYFIERRLTDHEIGLEYAARRRRAIVLFSLFALACIAGFVYVVTR